MQNPYTVTLQQKMFDYVYHGDGEIDTFFNFLL